MSLRSIFTLCSLGTFNFLFADRSLGVFNAFAESFFYHTTNLSFTIRAFNFLYTQYAFKVIHVLPIPTAHDIRVISARTWARARKKR